MTTVVALLGTLVAGGGAAAGVTLILIAIEIAFSFDNAIVNAKTLGTLSRFWQSMFLTLGMVIAVLGMRMVFPIVIVVLTAGLSWHAVLNLALHHPEQYADKLALAHPQIAAFGGGFLLVLALEFFMSDEDRPVWSGRIERPLKRLRRWWFPIVSSVLAVFLTALIPSNHYRRTTIVAGCLGILVHVVIWRLTHLLQTRSESDAPATQLRPKSREPSLPRTGMAALWTFVYLEVLDASFSFDGVVGAFAITNKVLLIAAGLGVGALWVRSLTVFMVRRGTLGKYIYLEHGAYYTIVILAFILLASIMLDIPDAIPGLVGMGIIGASVLASRQAMAASPPKR